MVLIDIFSSTGQKIRSQMLDFQSGEVLQNFSCSGWPAGIYWVRVSEGQGSGVRTVVVD
jgi:hypothetical protein